MRYAAPPLLRACLPLVLALLTGCAGDDATGPTEVTVADLAGSWSVIEFSVASQANPAAKVDLIASGGTMAMSIQSNGSFSGIAVIPGILLGQPGSITAPLSGVMRLVDAGTLRIDFIPEIPPIFRTMSPTFVLTETTLDLTDTVTPFDFDGDGVVEPATYRGSFVLN